MIFDSTFEYVIGLCDYIRGNYIQGTAEPASRTLPSICSATVGNGYGGFISVNTTGCNNLVIAN